MPSLLNRVKVNTATTGTGSSVTLGAAYSNAYCTAAEAGAVDGTSYYYVLEEGSDFELQSGAYTAAGTTLARGTPILSKIGGVAGTSKMNLAGGATVAIVAVNEVLYLVGGTDVAVTDGGTGASTASGARSNLGAAPNDIDVLVKTASSELSAERVVTDTPTVTVDWATAGQAKFNFNTAFLNHGFSILNGYITASVAGNALTVAIKTRAGTDPSSTDPVYIAFRSATASAGDLSLLTLTSAASLTVSSGSTLGTSNSTAFRLWVVGFNDEGTFRLGIIKCLSGTSIYPLSAWSIASSTAEGGAGAADSAQVFYTGTAVTSKPYIVLGTMTYESGLATAGTWSSAPDRIELFGPHSRLPGDLVQVARNSDGARATGTTQWVVDNTIPQNTEGNQFMTQAITPSSAANLLKIEHDGFYDANTTNATISAGLFKDSAADVLAAMSSSRQNASGSLGAVHLLHCVLAGSTSSQTFKIRAGVTSAGTVGFNSLAASAVYNGVAASHLTVEEIMV